MQHPRQHWKCQCHRTFYTPNRYRISGPVYDRGLSNMDTRIKQEIIQQGYGQMVTSKLRQRWEGYLLIFMFNQLRGSRRSVFRQMEREIERVYATVLTRIVRKPLSETCKDQLPIWIGCPDFPVPEHVKMELRDVVVNDGLHIHAIALIPPTSRLKTGLNQHFQD